MSGSSTQDDGFRLHPEVTGDLDRIEGYIAQDSITAAGQVIQAIRDTIRRLVPLPHRGHRRPDLTDRPLRFITVYDYLIAYAPDKKPLLVVGILYGRREPELLSSILSNRET